jgi:hypothetical protein
MRDREPVCSELRGGTTLGVNALITKRILSNIRTQCVPRSKHSPPQFKKTNHLMTCKAKVADCSQISTKHINAM